MANANGWEKIEVGGGSVEAAREQYGVRYRVDVINHPFFEQFTLGQIKALAANWRGEKFGWTLTCGGAPSWTPDRFLDYLKSHITLPEAFAAVLDEDNFVTRALSARSPFQREGR